MWHPTTNKWREIPHATHSCCYLSLKWGRNCHNKCWRKKNVLNYYYYYFCFICTFTCDLLSEGNKAMTLTFPLIASGCMYSMCSQSVSLIVDIHLSLITRLQTGGHWTGEILHWLYPAHVYSLIVEFNTSLCVSSWCLNYAHLRLTLTWSYKWRSALPHVPGSHRNASNNYQKDNLHPVIFYFTSLLQHCALTAQEDVLYRCYTFAIWLILIWSFCLTTIYCPIKLFTLSCRQFLITSTSVVTIIQFFGDQMGN